MCVCLFRPYYPQKLGIFEGSDAAWDNADYYYTFEELRKDFELEYRFKDLSMKLDIVKDNTRSEPLSIVIYVASLESASSLSHRVIWLDVFFV